ncbi:MAG: PilW family protein [Candidatus Muiribacteriota bacterium]
MDSTHDVLNRKKGFTLIEIMMALAISGFFLAALISFFISTNKLNTVYEDVAGLQQEIRAVMEMMSKDIMMAGLDPTDSAPCDAFNDGTAYPGSEDKNDTDENSISIKYDHNGDGSCDVDTAYWYDSANKTIMFRNGNGATFGAMTEDGIIESVTFEYILDDGTTLPGNDPTSSGDLDNISIVIIRVCGQITGAFEDEFDRSYCFENEIKPRNK